MSGVCIAVDSLAQSVDNMTDRKLGQLNLSTADMELSMAIVFWVNPNSLLISFLI